MKAKFLSVCVMLVGCLLFAVATASAQAPAAPGAGKDTNKNLLTLIYEGGWVMWPIGLCSIFTFYLAGDGFVRTGLKKAAPPEHEEAVKDLFRQGDYVGAYNYCREHPSPLTNVLRSGLGMIGEGKEAAEEGMVGGMSKENSQLQTWISYLSVVGVCTPMIGLLGTVTGMIKAFATLGSSGIGDPSSLAAAIGEVLVATASGLVIAIPAFFAYYILRNRAASAMHHIQDVIGRLFRHMPYSALAGAHLGDEELYAAMPNWTVPAAGAVAGEESPLPS